MGTSELIKLTKTNFEGTKEEKELIKKEISELEGKNIPDDEKAEEKKKIKNISSRRIKDNQGNFEKLMKSFLNCLNNLKNDREKFIFDIDKTLPKIIGAVTKKEKKNIGAIMKDISGELKF